METIFSKGNNLTSHILIFRQESYIWQFHQIVQIMKYSLSVTLLMYLLMSFSITPLPGNGEKRILFIRDTILPERVGDSSGFRVGNKTVSEKEIDSLIDRDIKATMQDLIRKKLITKSK